MLQSSTLDFQKINYLFACCGVTQKPEEGTKPLRDGVVGIYGTPVCYGVLDLDSGPYASAASTQPKLFLQPLIVAKN